MLTAFPDDKSASLQRWRRFLALWLAFAQWVVAASCTESVPIELPPLSHSSTSATITTRKASPDDRPVETSVAFNIDRPEFPVQTHDGTLNGTPVSLSRRLGAELYQRRLGDEIRLYPEPLLKRIKLRRIVLCEDLSFNKTNCFSFTDVEHGSIYINVQAGLDDEKMRWTIHHELFHQLDYAGDSRLDPDPVWESLNPIGFRYTGDVERLQADGAEAQRDAGIKGFFNRYATTSPTEDKAELFAFLVAAPEEARRRLAEDGILRRKAAKIREMIDAFGPYSTLLTGR
jgi:hypothetical protein